MFIFSSNYYIILVTGDNMAKTQKKLQKSIKKIQEKQKKEYPLKNQIMYFVKTIYTILILAILIYGITVIVNKDYKLEGKATKYDSSQIMAGQTFSKLDKEYYVVFYNFTTESAVTTSIENVKNHPIYRVNLALGINKSVISEISNNIATTASELQITGTTIIKISEGKNVEYIEGTETVKTYLSNLAK